MKAGQGCDFMAAIRITPPPFSFTPVDNVFIENYMIDARGDFIKVYLYMLKIGFSGMEPSLQEIAKAINLLETDIQRALEYWEQKGLMKISPTGAIELVSPQQREEVKNDVFFDHSVKDMFNGIEKLLGRPLSSKELSVYMSFIEDFKFTPEIINILIEYCSSKRKTDIRYIERVALAWNEAGIQSLDDAQRHITKFEDKWTRYRTILQYMGFKDGEISKPQEDMLEKWFYRFQFSTELIQEACKISVMRINECNFKYIDTILSDWFNKGYKDIEDVAKADKKTKPYKKTAQTASAAGGTGQQAQSSKRQYDVDELEKQLLGRGGKK